MNPQRRQPSGSPEPGHAWWRPKQGDWHSPWGLEEDAAPPPQNQEEPQPEPRAQEPVKRTAKTRAEPEPRVRDAGPAEEVYSRDPAAAPPRRVPVANWRPLVLLSLLVFAFTVGAWFYLHDTTPPWDGDLALPPAEETAQTIAAPGLVKALLGSVAAAEDGGKLLQPPWQWDTPSLASLLRRNEVALGNLQDLLEEYDWHPRHAAWCRVDLGSESGWMETAILKQAEAAYLERRGEEEAAFTAIMDIAVLARRMQELWAWPSYYARSITLHERACASLCELLGRTQLDAQRLGAFQAEFARCAPSDEVLANAMKGYYLLEKKLLLGPLSQEPIETLPENWQFPDRGRLFFKYNATHSLFTQSFRELVDAARRAPYARTDQIQRRLGPLGGRRFGTPNSNGENYLASRLDSCLRLPDLHSLEQARHAVVLALMAARRSLAENGKPPATLQELKPKYLAEAPADPYSGEPIQYDAARGLLFSVGANFYSEGGRADGAPLADSLEPTAPIAGKPQ